MRTLKGQSTDATTFGHATLDSVLCADLCYLRRAWGVPFWPIGAAIVLVGKADRSRRHVAQRLEHPHGTKTSARLVKGVRDGGDGSLNRRAFAIAGR